MPFTFLARLSRYKSELLHDPEPTTKVSLPSAWLRPSQFTAVTVLPASFDLRHETLPVSDAPTVSWSQPDFKR